MPGWIRSYVRAVETVNYYVGRMAMYILFVMMGILIWSSVTKIWADAGRFFAFPDWLVVNPAIWTLEMAQFALVAYYLLGAPYTFQLGTNVRMDLLYARLRPRTQALWDAFTIFALIFYLGVMLYGALDATAYNLQYGQRAPSAWRPYLWPITAVISVSFVLMILQATVHLIRDIAILRGKQI